MSDHDTTTTTSDHDPIRPAHYRDPATGRDRIAVWNEVMDDREFLAAIGATVDRYLSRAGLKPGVPAEQDHAKATEVARRYFEEWGEGADELLGEFLADIGHDHEAINALLLAAARPRTPTPPAEVTPKHPNTVGEWCAAEWARDAALALLPQGWTMRPGKHGYPEFVGKRDDRPAAIVWRGGNTSWRWAFEGQQDRSREVSCALDGIREADAALRVLTAEVTPQQAAGARPLPTREHVSTTMMPVASWVERQRSSATTVARPASQANPLAGVAIRLTPNELHALAWLVVRAGGFTEHERRAEHAIISAAQRCGWPNDAQPTAAQDDHAAALQRERERADRAERALRLERGAPLPGDLPEMWEKRSGNRHWYAHQHDEHSNAWDADAHPTANGKWRWWARHQGAGESTTAAEAIDAAHAALTAQRSDDTARDDGSDSSASGEGDSALPPDGYDWHDGAGDTEVLTDEHEEAAAWITRSTLPGGADQWSWWLASDSAIGVEKDVRHESTWKAARIGVRRAIERRRSDSSAQRSAEGGEA